MSALLKRDHPCSTSAHFIPFVRMHEILMHSINSLYTSMNAYWTMSNRSFTPLDLGNEKRASKSSKRRMKFSVVAWIGLFPHCSKALQPEISIQALIPSWNWATDTVESQTSLSFHNIRSLYTGSGPAFRSPRPLHRWISIGGNRIGVPFPFQHSTAATWPTIADHNCTGSKLH